MRAAEPAAAAVGAGERSHRVAAGAREQLAHVRRARALQAAGGGGLRTRAGVTFKAVLPVREFVEYSGVCLAAFQE